MKLFSCILFIYLTALTTLPSVRAMKVFFKEQCEISCHASDSDALGCEKGKIIMGLNFSPVQFVSELDFKPEIIFAEFKIQKEQSNYEKIFISKYQSSIWHPPKYI
ncbi:hypothetical protein NAT47_05160 [Flavobacterium sp. HXWNR69]|jgi:hypothetical protein|uniref:Uncharacterized protein n=1 Tax=Flavobacterium fragile TaxID=2949085 RepID=A0ABT0TFP9_9FLAO|nr:hypothetical protein [Flavobacterium sp. HXWNR69]MCL9769799.1 hypothetical protein [Flavobacterium sp. HXWNR69]